MRARGASWVGCAAVAAFAIAASAGCLHDSLVPCGTELCAATDKCVAGSCTSPAQLQACNGKADGDVCIVSIAGGHCAGGACQIAICGNNKLEYGEVCDDGNQVDGDGCSSRCDSTEICGNGVIDYAVGEQCDDGEFGRSGDGCSSLCDIELDGWHEASLVGPDTRSRFGLAYDASRDRVVLFGGGHNGLVTNDTWEFDGRNWLLRTPPTSPPARGDVAMAYDAATHRTVLFGGIDSTNNALGDTWEWDGVDWRLRTSLTSPLARGRHAMTYDANHQRVVLFGGNGASTPLKDTWEWDGTAWTQAASVGPGPLIQPLLVYEPTSQSTILFGGAKPGPTLTYEAVTWRWDGTSWTQLTPTTSPPGTRGAQSAWDPIGGGIIMVGGATATATNSPETWRWNGTTWQDLGALAAGNTLLGAGTTMEAVTGRAAEIFVYGGTLASGTGTNLAWLWDGANWKSANLASAPSARVLTAMATDVDRGRIVLNGGNDSNLPGDTWEWDGMEWLKRQLGTSPNAPPGRSGQALAYDIAHARTVMFGGAVGSGAVTVNDTYLWDGASWSANLSTPASPAARFGPVMAYDTARARVVMSGGTDQVVNPAVTFDDTWEWDGATWSVAAGTGAPPLVAAVYDAALDEVVGLDDMSHRLWAWDGAKWSHLGPPEPTLPVGGALAYHALRRTLVLYGGGDLTNAPGPTWEFDGTAWTQRSPTSSPPQRLGATLAYDPLRRQLVMFGGNEAGGVAANTWVYRFDSGKPIDACIDIDTDGDGLVGCADPDCAGRCTPQCAPRTSCDPAAPHCGDGTCSVLEDYLLCPIDCPVPP